MLFGQWLCHQEDDLKGLNLLSLEKDNNHMAKMFTMLGRNDGDFVVSVHSLYFDDASSNRRVKVTFKF